jgi:CRP/FNR family transcriptional regulator
MIMTVKKSKELFPGQQEELYNEIITHATIKEIRAGETLLRVGQTIRSAIMILERIVKLHREDREGRLLKKMELKKMDNNFLNAN